MDVSLGGMGDEIHKLQSISEESLKILSQESGIPLEQLTKWALHGPSEELRDFIKLLKVTMSQEGKDWVAAVFEAWDR